MISSRKRRSRRTGGLPIRRIAVAGVALAVFGAGTLAWFTIVPSQANPMAAKEGAARALALLDQGNATAARSQALRAVRDDAANPHAHLALARTWIATGNGVSAQAELQRAIDTGYDAKLVPQLRAQALLLQGEEERAIAQAAQAAPQFRGDAARIRAGALAGLGKNAEAQAAFAEAQHIAPNDADVWIDTGRFALATGDVLGAIQASERAVKLAPGDPDALVLRAEMVRTQFGLVAALPWFEEALKRDQWHHPALIEYAATLGDVGRSVDSLAAVRKAMEARPGDPQGYYLQAVIAARASDGELARAMLERIGDAIDSVPGAVLLAGALDLEKGDYEQAVNNLGPLVGSQPMNLEARKLFAVALLRTNSARNAIDILRPMIARPDADSYTLTLAARGYERVGDRAAAAKLLDRAADPERGMAAAFSTDDSLAVLGAEAAQRPGDPKTIVPMIRALIDKGDSAGALAKAQDIQARNPGVPAAYLLVGDMLMLDGRYGDAAGAYRKAADLRFDEPAMLRLVEALDRAGQREGAATVLALFLSQNPVNLAALRLSAQWQLAAGDYAVATDSLEQLRARIGDGDAALNAALATAYAGIGDTATAAEFGEAAYALAPASPVAADAFGWALYKQGDLPGAAELLRKAVALAPQHAGLQWHLAQVYADMGRKADAQTHARAALADPRFADRAAAQAVAGA